MNKVIEFFSDRETMSKSIHTTTEIAKAVAMIGNGVLMGSTWAICTAFPIIGVPLKICAAISAAALTDFLTNKTDAMIDEAAKFGENVYNSAMDYFTDKAE